LTQGTAFKLLRENRSSSKSNSSARKFQIFSPTG
jgi:hypothetical protein